MDVLGDERRAILFSSHNTQDVEQISDQIAFIDRGRVIEVRDKESFLEGWRRVLLEVPPGFALPDAPGILELSDSGRLPTLTTRAYSPELEASLIRAGARVREVSRMSLEEAFVSTVTASRRGRRP
jgi:ABC-2 type transport system ATP-binding protein